MFFAFHRFACALIAAATLVAMAGAARAQDERFSFNPPPAAPSYPAVTYQPRAPQWPDASTRITVTPLPGQGPGAHSPRQGTQMVCVRTCDGFFFPVGAGGSMDRAVAEFMCKASCPGAPVKLFMRRGADIADAVGADRSLYRRLASALNFRNEVSPTCSCRRPNGAITAGPVFDDPTLRVGDVIVVHGKAIVFKGGTRPYTPRDFASLEQSSLSADAKQKIGALLYFRSSVAVSSRTRKGAITTAAAAREPLGTETRPRVVLPFPLERETLPPTASAFAPAD